MSILAIGPHRVTNASIEHPVVDEMLTGVRLQVLYSDPPWGDGNLRYWATMNKKMTGAEHTPLTYSALVDRIRGLAERHLSGWLCIETGMRWELEVRRTLFHGYRAVASHLIYYASGGMWLPNVLVVGRNDGGTEELPLSDLHGLKDRGGMLAKEVVRRAGAGPGTAVLDPCCGMGFTARAAVAAGATFYGNEFNAVRLNKTIAFLQKATR